MFAAASVLIALMSGATIPSIQICDRPTEAVADSVLIVEIRTYTLKPGTRDAFHRLVVEEAVPMLRRWRVDLIAHGPSLHDNVTYFMIRSYRSLDDRQRSQDAFYGSAEWIDGPRERILQHIESYTSIVLQLDARTAEAMRTITPS
jgi:hypothetical protein